MAPAPTWWSKLGIEAVEPIALPPLTPPPTGADEAGGPRPRTHTGCPRRDDPLTHRPVDAVCHVHDRFLLFSDVPTWDRRLWRLVAHLPLYAGVLFAAVGRQRGLLAAFVLVVAGWFARIHVRRMKLARRWAVACLVVTGLVSGWVALPGTHPTWSGSSRGLVLVAVLLVVQYVRRTVGVRAAALVIPSSPSAHLWLDADGEGAASGVRACACAVVAVASLLAAAVAWGGGATEAAGQFAAAAVVALAFGLIVVMVAAAAARDADLVVTAEESAYPDWLAEPSDWQDLPPWPRSFRRFVLRIRRAVAEVLPGVETPGRAVTVPGSATTVGDRIVASIPDVIERTGRGIVDGLRHAVLPVVAAAFLVQMAARAGLALGDAVGGYGGWPVLVRLVAYTAATGLSVVVLVWAVTSVAFGDVFGTVVRSVLVTSPVTMVQLLVAMLLAGLVNVMLGKGRGLPALCLLLLVALAAVMAGPTRRRRQPRADGPAGA